MVDPFVAAIGLGLFGPVVAGPALAYGVDLLPREWRRRTEWSLIAGAGLTAILADLLSPGPIGGAFVYVLAALPGLITFLVWRSLLATAVVSLAPMYFVIAILTRGRPTYAPEIALDRAIPLEPAWMAVYGSLYVFVLILPLLVVRRGELIRRAMQAYITVMSIAYAGFLVYPTAAPRTGDVVGDGFSAWALRVAYSIDPPYNCFPSLHVAYAFVSALTCSRVHRGVGLVALVWAVLIAVSTVFTKQHYVLDVIGGALIAWVAYAIFLRGSSPGDVADSDRRLAPARAVIAAALFAVMVASFWIAYVLGY